MLGKRLQTIADLCTGNSLIDIGSDHAFIPIYLLNKQIIKDALALEINSGPLKNTQQNINKYKMEAHIKAIRSDGLNEISIELSSRYENIIIAGMGGELIINILNQNLEKFKNANIILQPNNNEEIVRKFLNKNNFKIIEEKLIKEHDKYYEIIVAKYQKKKIEKLKKEQLKFGIMKQDEIFAEKWSIEFDRLLAIKNKIPQEKRAVLQKIEEELELIKTNLKGK